jgi:hypothetical protein
MVQALFLHVVFVALLVEIFFVFQLVGTDQFLIHAADFLILGALFVHGLLLAPRGSKADTKVNREISGFEDLRI